MNDNANDSPSLDVVQISCSGCGVCCMHMGSSPCYAALNGASMDYTDSEQGQYDLQREQHEAEQRERLAFSVAEQVYDASFKVLDSIDELDGAIAGRIAKAVQDVVENELRHVL